MSAISRYLTAGAMVAVSGLGAAVAMADGGDGGHRDTYAVTPLVSDISGGGGAGPGSKKRLGRRLHARGQSVLGQ